MTKPGILICTVGTSLFQPNLENLRKELCNNTIKDKYKLLAKFYENKNLKGIASELSRLDANDRICGAEINSIASIIDKAYIRNNCGLFFLHSDTQDGHQIATILKEYYLLREHSPVETVQVTDLQDDDPKRFRTKGLRNLAREICKIIRQYSPAACAINATGGYKAQIAVGVLLGQAIGVPVYYKHERFSEIIAFPPLPVALDFEVWMQASGMLSDLARSSDPVPAKDYEDDWDEKYESLIERIEIDGQVYFDLSPTGQIFHDTFRERFRSIQDRVLPPPALKGEKKDPLLKNDECHMLIYRDEIERFLTKITKEVPQVIQCMTKYFNPSLSKRNCFRLSADGIEGIYSNGRYTVKFRVVTTAQTPGQCKAMVAALNQWLHENE
jgi:putative CRISPR-associated protein (TIGR02619 family)